MRGRLSQIALVLILLSPLCSYAGNFGEGAKGLNNWIDYASEEICMGASDGKIVIDRSLWFGFVKNIMSKWNISYENSKKLSTVIMEKSYSKCPKFFPVGFFSK
jgi:hypothetical protein